MTTRNYSLSLITISLALLITTPIFLFAQKEVNLWYFGNGAGLDFNSGTPVSLTDGAVVVAGGVTTVADTNGALLFYTDGFNIFNRNHTVMPNGGGTIVSGQVGQDVVIIPQPGSDSLYYMFIWDLYSIKYSLIDLSLDGGLGDIVSGTKNTFLFSQASQKLLAVHHCNREDFWFITHKWNSDQFYAYPITSGGIGPPVISTVGVVHQEDGNGVFEEVIGYLKSSSDGKKLASVVFNSNTAGAIELFDFDNVMGSISNGVVIDSLNEGALGVSFSPDQTKLYVTTFYGQNLYQYNLLDPDVTGSRTWIYNFPLFLGGLQLAPDGKVYVSHKDDPYLGVINDPDSLGLACNYVDSGIYLNGEQSVFGLPNLIETYLNIPTALTALFTYDSTSAEMTVSFNDSSQGNPVTWFWDFGDGNTDTLQNPIHTYQNPGTFFVCLTVTDGCVTDTLCDSISVTCQIPSAQFGFTNSNFTVNFSDSSTNATSWLWSFGDTNTDTVQNPIHVYANAGIYNVCLTASNNCDFDSICESITILTTGIDQYLVTVDKLKVYPNPVSTFATVTTNPAFKLENAVLCIYDLYGKEVQKTAGITTQKIMIDANQLATGMYFYRLMDQDKIIGSGKFIVE